MKKILAAFVFAAVILGAAGCLSVRAEAAVDVTVVNNNLLKDISLAFAWTTDGSRDAYSRGWYNAKANSTTTFHLADVDYSKLKKQEDAVYPKSGFFGFFARNDETTWRGTRLPEGEADENTLAAWILKNNDFKRIGERMNPDDVLEYFRIVSVESSGNGKDGTVSVELNLKYTAN
jgi:hypothetical protein